MSPCEQMLLNLIHDLAQPLSNIETSAYCLGRAIDADNLRAQQYLRLVEQQVDRARGLLAAASTELNRARARELGPVEAYEMATTASH